MAKSLPTRARQASVCSLLLLGEELLATGATSRKEILRAKLTSVPSSGKIVRWNVLILLLAKVRSRQG